jgi:hypothetical protein
VLLCVGLEVLLCVSKEKRWGHWKWKCWSVDGCERRRDGGTGSGSVDGCVEGEEVGALGVEGLEV